MKQIWAVTKLTIFMMLRRSYGLWLLFAIACVGAFIYGVCRSDGILLHEIQLRTRYAMTFSTSLFAMSILWISCVNMRGDIEAKRLHLLTAYPLRRVHIYLGKWSGMVAYSALGILTIMATTGLCTLALKATWADHDEVHEYNNRPSRVYRHVIPVQIDFVQEAENLLRERMADETPPDEETWASWREQIRDNVRRKVQALSPNGEKQWVFRLGDVPNYDDHVILNYRYYASDRKTKATLNWDIRGTNAGSPFTTTTTALPYVNGEIKVPMDAIPADGEIIVNVKGVGNQELVFSQKSSLKVLFRAGTFTGNCITFFLIMVAHFAAIVAVGFLVGTAFTTSVASFVAAVLYFLALTSTFFQGFLRELAHSGDGTTGELITRAVIRLGSSISTGLEPPAIIASLSDSMAITHHNMGMSMTRWLGDFVTLPITIASENAAATIDATGTNLLLGFILYLALATGVGIYMLSKKELDRIH